MSRCSHERDARALSSGPRSKWRDRVEESPGPVGRQIGPYTIVSLLSWWMGEVPGPRHQHAATLRFKVLPANVVEDSERLARSSGSAAGHAESSQYRPFTVSRTPTAPRTHRNRRRTDIADRLEWSDPACRITLAIARQTLYALDAAHEKGIVHRSETRQCRSRRRVKVLDFDREADGGDGPRRPVAVPTATG